MASGVSWQRGAGLLVGSVLVAGTVYYLLTVWSSGDGKHGDLAGNTATPEIVEAQDDASPAAAIVSEPSMPQGEANPERNEVTPDQTAIADTSPVADEGDEPLSAYEQDAPVNVPSADGRPTAEEGAVDKGVADKGVAGGDDAAAREPVDKNVLAETSPAIADQAAGEQAAAAPGTDGPSTEETKAKQVPVFDVVRIEPDGSGVVAGRAEPDTQVDIVVAGEVVGEAQTGSDGAFVALIETKPSSVPQEVRAEQRGSDDEESAVSEPLIVIGRGAEETPVIVQPEEDQVRVVQPAQRRRSSEVTLDTISYNASGQVMFSGRANEAAVIRLYLDQQLIAQTRTGADGRWATISQTQLSAGLYTLRVDEVDAEGKVASRVSTPFLREPISSVVTAENGEERANTLTVQAGDNLWQIAENRYGQGERYTLIFGANSEQISDPDLIFPGQIFSIPEPQ